MWCLFLSAEIKTRLSQVTQEDNEQNETELETQFPAYKALLLKVAKAKTYDFLLWMEGNEQNDPDEKLLNLLERANLIKGQTKYTHRNVYRQYELTKKGQEIAEKLAAEP